MMMQITGIEILDYSLLFYGKYPISQGNSFWYLEAYQPLH